MYAHTLENRTRFQAPKAQVVVQTKPVQLQDIPVSKIAEEIEYYIDDQLIKDTEITEVSTDLSNPFLGFIWAACLSIPMWGIIIWCAIRLFS